MADRLGGATCRPVALLDKSELLKRGQSAFLAYFLDDLAVLEF